MQQPMDYFNIPLHLSAFTIFYILSTLAVTQLLKHRINQQYLAIARALRRQPNILIFDEALSNLDQSTSEQFVQTINRLKGKVTILFIMHQLPKGFQVDEAVVLGKTEINQAESRNSNNVNKVE